jgi:hypothetical protein
VVLVWSGVGPVVVLDPIVVVPEADVDAVAGIDRSVVVHAEAATAATSAITGRMQRPRAPARRIAIAPS